MTEARPAVDRVAGVLVGWACGDALGAGYEFGPAEGQIKPGDEYADAEPPRTEEDLPGQTSRSPQTATDPPVSDVPPGRQRRYFDGWKEEPIACSSCGWSGLGSGLDLNGVAEEAEALCPTCHTKLLHVTYPTEAELRAAAPNHSGAQRMLQDIEESPPPPLLSMEPVSLTDAGQLPHLTGRQVVAELTYRGRKATAVDLILNHVPVLVEAGPEVTMDRIDRIISLLRVKYGGRLVWVDARAVEQAVVYQRFAGPLDEVFEVSDEILGEAQSEVFAEGDAILAKHGLPRRFGGQVAEGTPAAGCDACRPTARDRWTGQLLRSAEQDEQLEVITDCSEAFHKTHDHLTAALQRCSHCGTTWLEGYYETPQTDAKEWDWRGFIHRPLTAANVTELAAAAKSGSLDLNGFAT